MKNQKLWIILDKLSDKHKVNWLWVKSHSGHPQNEQVDNAAKEAAKKLQSCYILYNEI